ncbi:MAG TPA: endonuclease/exonuclease/phosphatase family protein [Candidatus Saccharimonadales bacterium]
MSIRLAQWNVQVYSQPRLTANVVERVRADIWCMQEVTRRLPFRQTTDLCTIMQDLGYNALFVPTREEKGGEGFSMGNAIFSRYPLEERWFVQLQKEDRTSNPNSMTENRYAIAATVSTPIGELAVATAHLSWQNSLLQAEGPGFLRAMQRERDHFVIAGDLNATPDSQLVQQLNSLFAPLNLRTEDSTWPTRPASFEEGTIKVEPLSRQYDYVRTTPDIAVIGGLVLADEMVCSASDHAVVIAQLAES